MKAGSAHPIGGLADSPDDGAPNRCGFRLTATESVAKRVLFSLPCCNCEEGQGPEKQNFKARFFVEKQEVEPEFLRLTIEE
jgi:hypothetical protein